MSEHRAPRRQTAILVLVAAFLTVNAGAIVWVFAASSPVDDWTPRGPCYVHQATAYCPTVARVPAPIVTGTLPATPSPAAPSPSCHQTPVGCFRPQSENGTTP